MLHLHNILNEFIMGLQREKIMRLEGVFMGSIMGDEGSDEQSGAWHKKMLQEIMGSHNSRKKKIMGS